MSMLKTRFIDGANRALTSLLIQRIYNDILIDMSMLKTRFIDGAK